MQAIEILRTIACYIVIVVVLPLIPVLALFVFLMEGFKRVIRR